MNVCNLTLPFACSLLAAAASAAPQCPPDAFEPNESCFQPPLIGAGTQVGLTVAPGDLDFFAADVPAGQRIEVRVQFHSPSPSLGGLLILIRDDGSALPCDDSSNEVASTWFAGGQPNPLLLTWSTPATAAERFIVELANTSTDCGFYDLDVAIVPDPCAALPDDVFEPNDTCATAAPLGTGTFNGLSAGVADPDHFLFLVAPKEVLSIALSGLAQDESVLLCAWDPNACGGANPSLGCGGAFGPAGGGIYLANTGVAPRAFVVRVDTQPDAGTGVGFCVSYSLSVSSEFDPCGAITGDAFDPNSSCFTAAPLGSTQTDLKAHAGGDFDWYSIDVAPRSTLRLRSKSTQNMLIGPMLLWDSCGPSQDLLASSHHWLFDSTDPRHWLQWFNPADFGVNTRLLMSPLNQSFPAPFCDTYQLEFEITLGEPFCLPAKNSSGDAALLSAVGSTQVGVGTLELSATLVPANSIGLVFFGVANKPPMPFGGGWMCIKAPLWRLPASSTGTGTLHTSLDWTGSAAAITPGESFSFQAWFRDPVATPSFNLSEGLEIAFQ